MDQRSKHLIDLLNAQHELPVEDYAYLISHMTSESAAYAARIAVAVRQKIYGDQVFVRGLIEVSNYCKNDCLYCGIRKGNKSCGRYRLAPQQIIACANEGYELGFRTFVLQGGEDPWFTDDRLCQIVSSIKQVHPDCAITLSMGERSYESYVKLAQAGADRYLLRHETASSAHYAALHPKDMSFSNRMDCLANLRKAGFVVGSGFMVGSPGQTPETLAQDLKFIETFKPEMCGIGPFIPHHATPFSQEPQGSLHQTLFLLSLIRLIKPNILLPATTALGTIHPEGREMGMHAGANVVMPNLSPSDVRLDYQLYDGKICTGEEAAEGLQSLKDRMAAIGYRVVIDRGDPKE